MAIRFNQPKSVLVILFIRLLLLGQISLFMSVSVDACADLITDGLWWSDFNFSIDGCSDLVNSVYLILYFIAVYIVYQFILFLFITSHDFDIKFLAVIQFLKRFITSFSKLLKVMILAQVTFLCSLHLFSQLEFNSFRVMQVQVSASYLPFV